MSTQTAACRGADSISFRRIVCIPFDTCVAALEGLLREGNQGEAPVGRSRLRGPIRRDRHCGTCRVEVRLARGPLRPVLRMRLNVDCWSPPPSSTALELIPHRRVRATASYFRAGHLLLDSLIHSLQLQREMQVLDCPAGEEPETDAVGSGSRLGRAGISVQPVTKNTKVRLSAPGIERTRALQDSGGRQLSRHEQLPPESRSWRRTEARRPRR